MSHGEDPHQALPVSSVNETIRITSEDVTSGVHFEARPTERCCDHLFDGVIQVGKKAFFRAETALPVPVSGFLDLAGGPRMEDQATTGHGDRA